MTATCPSDLHGENAMSEEKSGLSDEQVAIITLVAEGWPDKRIATEIGLSIATVQRRLLAAARQLGVESRVGLVVRAIALGLIEAKMPESSPDENK